MSKKSQVSSKPIGKLEQQTRDRLMRELPARFGVRWVNDSCSDMLRDGRRIEGGWPGTLREARARMQNALSLELAALGMEAATPEELTIATASAYDRAKVEWQRAGKAQLAKDASGSRG